MSVQFVAELPALADIQVGLSNLMLTVRPLLAQLDLTLTGSFGIGSMAADISAQLSAALSSITQLALSLASPLAAFMAALAAIGSLSAVLSLALSAGIAPLGLEIAAQLAAVAAIAAQLSLKMGGLKLLMEVSLSVKLPVVGMLADLGASLSAGPVDLLTIDQDPSPFTLQAAGTRLSSLFSTGVGTIAPTDLVYGVVIVTKAPEAWAGIQATLLP